MTTLVTGGNGFVGSAVVRVLLARVEEVRTLLRPGSDRRNLDGLEVGPVEGDLTEPASLALALRRHDALYHVAADYRLGIRAPTRSTRPMWRTAAPWRSGRRAHGLYLVGG